MAKAPEKKEKDHDCTCCFWCNTIGATKQQFGDKEFKVHPKCAPALKAWLVWSNKGESA